MPFPGDQRAPAPVFVYSADYNMDLGPHVFPSVKFGYVYDHIRRDRRFSKHRFVEPEPLTRAQAALVHEDEFIEDLVNLNQTKRLYRSELPLTQGIVQAFFLASGGTLVAARQSLDAGRAMNLSGGFHHAFADHAEGFCYLNDVAIAIRVLQGEKRIRRALVVDLDVHQGNGTARIFQGDDSVFTFSMHEEKNYPIKETSDLDIGLETGCRDNTYLSLLADALDRIAGAFEPDIVFYLAGVDTFEEDLLGGIQLTREGMAERDRMVRDGFPEVPLVTVLAGGYSRNTDHTVELHVQTCEVLADLGRG